MSFVARNCREFGIYEGSIKDEDVGLHILVEDYLTGQALESGQDLRLTDQLIEDRGEPILQISHLVRRSIRLGESGQSDGLGAQIIDFRR